MSIRGIWKALRYRLGLRGDILLALGVIDLAQAISLATNSGAVTSSYEWFGAIAPLPGWAALWSLVGLICIYHAFRKDDHFGFVAAIGIKIVWGIGSFAAWILSEVTFLGGVLWLMFAAIVWRVSKVSPTSEDMRA